MNQTHMKMAGNIAAKAPMCHMRKIFLDQSDSTGGHQRDGIDVGFLLNLDYSEETADAWLRDIPGTAFDFSPRINPGDS